MLSIYNDEDVSSSLSESADAPPPHLHHLLLFSSVSFIPLMKMMKTAGPPQSVYGSPERTNQTSSERSFIHLSIQNLHTRVGRGQKCLRSRDEL